MEGKFLEHIKGENTSRKKSSDKPAKETVSNGFFTVDQKWTVTYWNKTVEKVVGILSGDIVGKNLWEGFENIVPPEFSKLFQHSFLKDSPVHFEEYLGKMGNWFDVVLYHCDDRLSVSFKSIYQKVKIEDLQQQLTQLNELYRFVTEITNDCLWEWELDTKEIFWIDGGHKRIFGYQIENALIPQSFWEDHIHPDDRTPVLKNLNNIKTGEAGGLWEQEYRFKKANGEYLYVKDRGQIIFDQETATTRMFGTTQDVTAGKTSELLLVHERLVKQKEISYAVLTAQENERLEIGRELHHNLNQVLCAAKIYIELAKADGEQRIEHIEKSSGFIMSVIEGIRMISKKLRMPGMNMGLFDSMRFLVDKTTMSYPIKMELLVNGIDEEDMDETLQLDIYRMVQEMINNIIQHSGAGWAIINLTRQGNEITLLVSDNGRGCDLLKARIGMGTINILSHAELYQSNISPKSSPGNGYEWKVVLPLSGRAQPILHLLSDYDD
jgi:PAS domain S-box-containing protein